MQAVRINYSLSFYLFKENKFDSTTLSLHIYVTALLTRFDAGRAVALQRPDSEPSDSRRLNWLARQIRLHTAMSKHAFIFYEVIEHVMVRYIMKCITESSTNGSGRAVPRVQLRSAQRGVVDGARAGAGRLARARCQHACRGILFSQKLFTALDYVLTANLFSVVRTFLYVYL